MNHSKKYGWRPSVVEVSDKLFEAAPVAALPPSVDLRPAMPPVYNQGDLGSCTANALSACVEHLREISMPSRLFIYYNERTIDGDVDQDSGSTIKTGIQALRQFGVCPENVWPYDPANFAEKPNQTAYTDATPDIIGSYMKLQTLDDIKRCLASGFPVAFGFMVFNYFESQDMLQTGILQLPTPGEVPIGGHAVVIVGYDDTKQSVLVRNSWGSDWGIGGYFWMPYQYVTNPQLASDFWTIRSFSK